MKEATGELNITVITVIAVAAVAALFYAFVWPAIQTSLRNNTCKTMGEGWHSVVQHKGTGASGAGDNTTYACCPKDVTSYDASKCAKAE